jgi:hypothetical protein
MDSSSKRNWLIELTDFTNQDRDDFIKVLRDPLNHVNVNQNNCLVCAVVHYFTAKQEKKEKLKI